jgi:hypothetical protein
VKNFAVISALLLLSGCSLFGGVVEKVAGVVDEYCTRETYNARQLYRDQINTELLSKGHSVEVHCAGDPAPVSP